MESGVKIDIALKESIYGKSVIVASYDYSGSLLEIKQAVSEDGESCSADMRSGADYYKVFVWDSLSGMKADKNAEVVSE